MCITHHVSRCLAEIFPESMIPLANLLKLHCIARKKTDHEVERAKEVSDSENRHACFAIARFPRLKRFIQAKPSTPFFVLGSIIASIRVRHRYQLDGEPNRDSNADRYR